MKQDDDDVCCPIRRNSSTDDECEVQQKNREHDSVYSTGVPLPTDNGYAWVILGAMFLSNVITAGYVKSFGLIYNAVAEVYPDSNGTMGGTMIGLLAGCRSCLAMIVGAAATQFGCRPLMGVGVLLSSSGLLLAFFSTSVGALAVTLGVLVGTGLCCIETPQIVIFPDYFKEKKELANSIRVSGNPLGAVLMPFVFLSLFINFGVKLSFVMIAGIMLQLLVLVSLVLPFKTHELIIQNQQRKKNYRMISSEEEDECVPPPDEKPASKSKKIDLNLLRNPLYMTHVAMMCFISSSIPHCIFFLPLYGRSIGLLPTQNSTVLAIQAVSDFSLRIILGLFLNKNFFKKTHALALTLWIGGLGIALIPFTDEILAFSAAVFLFSFGSAGFYATINCILIDQFGKEKVSTSWGFIRMQQGFLNFIYPPILGAMVDFTGNYFLTFLTMGGGMATAGLCIALQPLVLDW